MGSTLMTLLSQYAIPFLLLPLFLFIIFFSKYQSSTTNKKKLPPSPPKLPIIGNLHQLGKLPHQSLQSLSRKYGDIMLLHFGSTPTLVVSSAEVATQVLKTHDLAFCSKKAKWKFFTKLLNNGKDVIAAPYGEYWRRMRSICVHELLSNKRVQSFTSVREEEVAIMVNNINKMALSSIVINMRDVFESIAYNVVSRATIGMNDHKDIVFGEVTREMSKLMGRFSIGDFIPWLGCIDWLNGDHDRVNKVTKATDGFLEAVISEHSELSGDKSGTFNKAFVDVLLDLQKSGNAIDRDSIKGLLLDMFAAGTETSSTVLEWMMSEILMSPRVMEKLQEEVNEAAKGKEVITEDSLKNMVYLKAVVQETLRLHHTVPLLPRESAQDVQIDGYDISAGTLVFINGWAIVRDPRYWEEPESFLPERFLNSSMSSHVLKMIPFGYGRRSCPGESFALVTIELVMANLLLKFDWKMSIGEGEDVDHRKEHPGITTRRFTPLLAVATPRFLQQQL